MKRVLVLSKTKMQDNRVCVGGVDLDNRCSVRLLDYSGHHESIELCPYNLLDIWEVEYCKTNRRPAPHLEDVNVIRRQRANENIDASNLLNILSNGGVNIYNKGSLFSAFDGKLCSGGSHSLYINHNNGVPDHSTCFWVSDKTIRQSRFSIPEKVKFEYCHNDVWYQIAYVGFEPVPDVIPAGTEVLVSMETAAYAYFSTITFDTDYTIEPGKVNVIGLESDAWIRRHKQEWASNATWTAPYTNVCHSSHGPGFLIDKVKVVTQSDGTVTNNGEASLWQYPWKSGQERVDHSYDWTYDAKVDGEFGKAPMVAIINLGQVEYVHTLWLQRRVLTNSATKYTTTGEIWFSNDTTGDELHSAHLLQNLTTGIYQDAHLHNYWGVFWKHKKWMKVADFKFGTKDQALNTYPGGLHARYVMIVLKPDLKVLPSDGTPLLDMCEIDMKVFPRVAE